MTQSEFMNTGWKAGMRALYKVDEYPIAACDFEEALKDLDKEASYSVYCRSGNRSAAAVELMRNEGFTNVVDLGAVEDAAKTLALPIVAD